MHTMMGGSHEETTHGKDGSGDGGDAVTAMGAGISCRDDEDQMVFVELRRRLESARPKDKNERCLARSLSTDCDG